MKAVINDKGTPVKYPWIGIRKDKEDYTVVLFISKYTGTCIASDNPMRELWEYDTEWNEENFTPFTGTITLSND